MRSLSEKPVEREKLEKLLNSARWAPSAGNQQPLEIIVVEDPAIKERMNEATGNQGFFVKAPYVLVILNNPKNTINRYKERGRTLYQFQDTAAAIQNILLHAVELGLASTWIGAFYEDKISEIFNIPDDVRPVAILPIAYPNDDPKGPGRKPIEEIIHRNTYGSKYFE
ncbi:MAG: nitroreductase family protein [Candidatus Heimdallarchaeota archaeon]|nr:nitroreductase family protein [Candidatus Heimdallarchaeota archaeon]